MAPGWLGMFDPTVLHLAALAPHALVAVTQTGGAPVYTPGKFTVIAVVLVPDVIVHPVGTVQLYPDAPVTAAMEKFTPVAPGHTLAGPLMAPGVAGFLVM